MRLYNNDPTYVMPEKDTYDPLLAFFSSLKERKFILRDLYTFGCPRVGGLMNSVSWAGNYKVALNHHVGQSWRVVNQSDPVTGVPPIVPLISTWNHIDNGYQVDEGSLPKPLPTEIGKKPFGYNIFKFRNHCEFLVFKLSFSATQFSSC
jgi:hypothetical protein